MTEQYFPTELYRYRGDQTNKHFQVELSELAKGRVYLAPLSGQNDELEGRPEIISNTFSEWRNVCFEAAYHLPPDHELVRFGKGNRDFRKFMKSRRKWQRQTVSLAPENIHIACFSDASSHDEGKMWKDYANGGRGYRLHFKFLAPPVSVENPLWVKVQYKDARRPLNELELICMEYQINGAKIFNDYPERWVAICQSFAACKLEKWSDEGEFRLVEFSPPSNRYLPIPNYKIDGVTFGKDANSELIGSVKRVLGNDIFYRVAA